jgi:hypothetical protein
VLFLLKRTEKEIENRDNTAASLFQREVRAEVGLPEMEERHPLGYPVQSGIGQTGREEKGNERSEAAKGGNSVQSPVYGSRLLMDLSGSGYREAAMEGAYRFASSEAEEPRITQEPEFFFGKTGHGVAESLCRVFHEKYVPFTAQFPGWI